MSGKEIKRLKKKNLFKIGEDGLIQYVLAMSWKPKREGTVRDVGGGNVIDGAELLGMRGGAPRRGGSFSEPEGQGKDGGRSNCILSAETD